MTGAELMATDQKPREFAVDGLVPIGSLTLIYAKKSRNKSVAALVMADKVSRGEPFLNRSTRKGRVLYIGTEDDEIELSSRYGRLLESYKAEPSTDLDLTDNWPKVAAGGIEAMHRWAQEGDDARMIVVDIAGAVDPRILVVRRGWIGALESVEDWQELARSENVAVVLVAHMYPRGPDFPDNPIAYAQGSGGITAYARTLLFLQGKAHRPERLLDYNGKFGHGQMWLQIDPAAMTCELDGAHLQDVKELAAARARLAELVATYPGMKAREYVRWVPERTTDATVKLLQTMADESAVTVVAGRYFADDSEMAIQLSLENPAVYPSAA